MPVYTDERPRLFGERCLEFADAGLSEDIRLTLLSIARLCMREADLIASSNQRIAESRELIARANALLDPRCA